MNISFAQLWSSKIGSNFRNTFSSDLLTGKVLTKGVNVEIMEDPTPYELWNDYRSRYSDMYKEPSKVVMENVEQIYPELLDDMNFPKFLQDYMEVSAIFPETEKQGRERNTKERNEK